MATIRVQGQSVGTADRDWPVNSHDCECNSRVNVGGWDELVADMDLGSHGTATVGTGATLLGVVFANCAVISNCPVMACNALVKRHLAPPTNRIGSGDFRISYLRLLTRPAVAAFEVLCVQDPDRWRVGRGVTKLGQIEESCAFDGLAFDRVNMMLKKEVNIVPFSTGELPSKARAIQFSTNLRTAYENATEQTSFCHALAKATSAEYVYNGVVCLVRYTAEMSPGEIAEFATANEARRAAFAASYLDERDGKNWDANVQPAHRDELAKWYDCFSRRLGDQARAAITVRGAYQSQGVKVSYSVKGTVKSGHWDTSSGNGALNLEVTMQAIGMLPVGLRPAEVRGMIMGDDLLLWLYFNKEIDPAQYSIAINQLEAGLGIHPVRGLFRDILNVSFCSLTFYWRKNGQLVSIPKLGRIFAKLFWTVTPLQSRCPLRLASTIAHAFYPTYCSFKPAREFLQHHMKVPPLEVAADLSLPYILRKYELPEGHDILWDSCNLVKYNIAPSTLDDVGELVRTVGAGGIHHPGVELMILQDQSDPPERLGVEC